MPSTPDNSLAVQLEHGDLERSALGLPVATALQGPIEPSTAIPGLEVKESDWSAWDEAFKHLSEATLLVIQNA